MDTKLIEQLADVAELQAKATHGPWTAWQGNNTVFEGSARTNTPARYQSDESTDGREICRCEPDHDDEEEEGYNSRDNTAFIAAAGSLDFAALLAALTAPALDAVGGGREIAIEAITKAQEIAFYDYQGAWETIKPLLPAILAALRTAGATAPLPANESPEWLADVMAGRPSYRPVKSGIDNYAQEAADMVMEALDGVDIEDQEYAVCKLIGGILAERDKDVRLVCKELRAALAALASSSAAGSQWVSVANGLPDNTIFQGSHMVLVHLWNGTQLAAYYDYSAGFWREHTEGEKLTITHWQPLPAPPTPGQA